MSARGVSVSGAPRAFYFAYGANMSTPVLAGQRGLRPQISEAAELRGFRLVFDLPGIPLVEPAFASVIAEAGSVVPGVLHALTPPEVQRLDRFESPRYQRKKLAVVGRSLGEVEAEVYVNRRPRPGGLPSRRYLDLLVRGAEEHGLSEAHIAWLRSHPSGDVALLRPFAGTLFALVRWARVG